MDINNVVSVSMTENDGTYLMKQISSLFENKKIEKTKARCQHQELMELVINAGYAPKKFQPRWAKWLKQSGINSIDLKRLIEVAKKLPADYSPAGFVRNRLLAQDWVKYFD